MSTPLVQTISTVGSSTYTVPAGTWDIAYTIIAGGGGGGGARAAGSGGYGSGGGGGGGQTKKGTLTAVSGNTNITTYVGKGGDRSYAINDSGQNFTAKDGEDTFITVNGITYSANKGLAGKTWNNGAAGGLSGSGVNSLTYGKNGNNGSGGDPNNETLGGAGGGTNDTNNGPGVGGSGGELYGNAYMGVNGSSGIIILTLSESPSPSPPQNLVITPGNKILDFTFDASISDPTSYTATLAKVATPTVILETKPALLSTTNSFSDLINGENYTISVYATKSGYNSESVIANGIPNGAPLAATNISLDNTKKNELKVMFTPSTSPTPSYVTNYTVSLTAPDQTVLPQTVTSSPATFTGLVAGVNYTAIITANYSGGTVVSQSAAMIVSGDASPVTITSAEAGNQQITVIFSASTTLYSELGEYIITLTPTTGTPKTFSVPATDATSFTRICTDLEKFIEYTVKVEAKGTGNPINNTPIPSTNTLTAIPTGELLRPDSVTADVSIVDQVSISGTPVLGATSYQVEAYSTGTSHGNPSLNKSQTTLPIVLTKADGLLPGTLYFFKLRGVRGNINGYLNGTDIIQAPGAPYVPLSGDISVKDITTNSAVVIINKANLPRGLTYYCSATSATETKISTEILIVTAIKNSTSPLEVSFNNLSLGSTYTLAVCSKGETVNETNYILGKTEYSPPITFTTLNVLPPTINSVTPGNNKLTVNFTPDTQVGGITATGYTVSLSPGNLTSPAIGINGPYSAEFTGLTNGVTYTATVTVNSSSGPNSSTQTGMPNGPLPVLTSIVVTPAIGQLTVSYNSLPGAVSYSAQAYLNDVAVGTPISGSATSLIIPSLANGVLYTIKVKGKDASDIFGAEATSSVTMVSGKPTASTATIENITKTTANVVINSTPTLRYSVMVFNGNDLVKEINQFANGMLATSSLTTIPITELTKNTEYSVAVITRDNLQSSIENSDIFSIDPNFKTLDIMPPTINSVTPGNGSLIVNFTPSLELNPTNHVVQILNGTTVVGTQTFITPTSQQVVTFNTDLINGIQYTAKVIVNVGSESGPTTATGTPNGPPAPPTNVTVTNNSGDNALKVNYTLSASPLSYITGYDVILTPSGGAAIPVANTVNEFVINSPSIKLIAGVSYSVVVRAKSANGNTDSSAVSGIPKGNAEQATITNVIEDNKQITVNFSASASLSADLDSYVVTLIKGTDEIVSNPIPATAATTYSYKFEGLTNYLEYSAIVTTTGKAGRPHVNPTPVSSLLLKATPTGPDEPINVRAEAGRGQAVVYFDGPIVPAGGSLITEYTVTSSPGGRSASGSASPITVTGLTNGSQYTFTVTAKNALTKVSAASNTSLAVTPTSVPDAPSLVSAVSGNNEVTLTFTPPFNGGLDIQYYTIYSDQNGFIRSLNADASPFVYNGLQNGEEYEFQISAHNLNGDSDLSNVIKATPASLAILEIIHVIPNVKTFMNSVTALNIEDGGLLKFADLGVNVSVLTTNEDKKNVSKKLIKLLFAEKTGLKHFKVKKSLFPIISSNAKDNILVVNTDNDETFEIDELDSTTSIYVAMENENDSKRFMIGTDEFIIGKTATGYGLAHNDAITYHNDGGQARVNDLLIVFGGGSISFSPFLQSDPVCYARGTLIGTSRGWVPIENLLMSDNLRTYDRIKESIITPVLGNPVKSIARVKDTRYKNRFAGIKFIGKFTVNKMNEHTAPIRITTGALGENKPEIDLLVSPNHSVLVRNRFIFAKNLVNGSTIYQDMSFNKIEYFHVLSDDHYVINANGVLSETLGSEEMFIFENMMNSDQPLPTETKYQLQDIAI